MEIKHYVISELLNTPGAIINTSHLEWHEIDVWRIMCSFFFPFISWPSEKLLFKPPFIWHRSIKPVRILLGDGINLVKSLLTLEINIALWRHKIGQVIFSKGNEAFIANLVT